MERQGPQAMSGFFALFLTAVLVLALAVGIQKSNWFLAGYCAFILIVGVYLGLRRE